jgi:hypothetical protein
MRDLREVGQRNGVRSVHKFCLRPFIRIERFQLVPRPKDDATSHGSRLHLAEDPFAGAEKQLPQCTGAATRRCAAMARAASARRSAMPTRKKLTPVVSNWFTLMTYAQRSFTRRVALGDETNETTSRQLEALRGFAELRRDMSELREDMLRTRHWSTMPATS